MSSSFWSNTIWYILLAITSIISIVFWLIKSKNRKFTIVFTLATLGFVYLAEAILVISFKAYNYSPKIAGDVFQDTVMGNVFSQVSISTTSTLAIVYELSYKWYFIFAAIYFFIEELFVKLGIYHQFWYKTIYTFIGFIPLFWFLKMWHNKLTTSSKYFIHHATLFLSTFAVASNTIIMPMRFFEIQIFKVNFYGEISKNHTTTAIIYGFFLINILIILYRWISHWIWKGTVFAILFLIQYVLYKSGIIYFKVGWFIAATLFDLLGIYLWIVVLERFLCKNPSDHCDQPLNS